MTTAVNKILLTFVVMSKFARKIFCFLEIFRPIKIREKIEFQYSIFYSFESRDQWPLLLRKFYWIFLYFRNPREKIFFFYKIFRPIRIREKIEFNYSTFLSFESRDQWLVLLTKFYWPFLYWRNWREKIFFYRNFSTNQNSRKNRIPLFDFLLIGIERPMTTDGKKILLTFVVLSKSARKNFFLLKFFDQSELQKKSNFIIRFFTHWNRETDDHWC